MTQSLIHPSSFRLHSCFLLARGEAFEARAAEASFEARAQLGARLVAQLHFITPAARERRAADELDAAGLARRRLAQRRRDERGQIFQSPSHFGAGGGRRQMERRRARTATGWPARAAGRKCICLTVETTASSRPKPAQRTISTLPTSPSAPTSTSASTVASASARLAPSVFAGP